MGVIFRAFGAGNPPRVRQFSDPFTTNVNTFGLKENYFSGPLAAGSILENSANFMFRSATGAAIRCSTSSANARNSVVFWPRAIASNVTGNQFAQVTCVSDNSLSGSGNVQGGVFVLSGWQITADQYKDYCFLWGGPDGGANQNQWILRKTLGVGEVVLASGASGTLVAGQVMRLEARINTGTGDVTLEGFVDGVSVVVFVDNAATKCELGCPGFGRGRWVSQAVPGIRTQIFSTFSCGSL